MIKVTFITIGRAERIEIKEESIVRDVLSFLNIPKRNNDVIFVNGEKQHKNAILKDGDIVGLFFSIRGEVTVKCKGDIWRVYKTDADDQFPSDFHAHNVCATRGRGETLDLYTGKVYDAKFGHCLRQLPRKTKEFIIRELERKEQKIKDKCRNKVE